MPNRRQVLVGLLLGSTAASCSNGQEQRVIRGLDVGIFPDTGLDLTQSVNDVMRALMVTGGRLQLEPGIYILGPLTVPSGVVISGRSTVLRAAGPCPSWLTMGEGRVPPVLKELTLDARQRMVTNIVRVPSGSATSVRDCVLTSTVSVHGISVTPGAHSVSVLRTSITGAATAVYVRGAVAGVELDGLQINKWRQRALSFVAGTDGGARDVTVKNSDLNPPLLAGKVRQPLSFTGREDGFFSNVRVENNVVRGTGRSYLEPRGVGVADLISLHRCHGFAVVDNTCTDGGDVGITVAHGSSDGEIVGNVCRNNDSCGIALGSGASTLATQRVRIGRNKLQWNGRDRTGKRTLSARSQIWLYGVRDVYVTDNLFQVTPPRASSAATTHRPAGRKIAQTRTDRVVIEPIEKGLE